MDITGVFEQMVKLHFNRPVFNILKENNCIIAGGALTSLFTNRPLNDYDIYFKSKDDYNKVIDIYSKSKYETGFKMIHTSDNADTFLKKEIIDKYVFQFIKADHLIKENPMDIINNFDFTINMAAYDLKEEKLIVKDKFFYDNIKRYLIFNEDTYYPIISMHRAVKYMSRGYKLPGHEQVKIALAINNLKMKDYRDLKVQLQGIDTSAFANLTDKLMDTPDADYNYKKALDLLKENIKAKEKEKSLKW